MGDQLYLCVGIYFHKHQIIRFQAKPEMLAQSKQSVSSLGSIRFYPDTVVQCCRSSYLNLNQMSSSDPIATPTLTKRTFMDLPSGQYLVSNVGHSISEPCFAEYVTLEEHRSEQWERIKMQGVEQRKCMVFHDEKSYRDWVSHNLR